MATLSGKSIASTYTSLLKLEGDTGSTVAGASGNAVQVKTGDDDSTPLYLNTDRIGIGTATPTYLLDMHSSGDSVARIYSNSGGGDAMLRLGNPDRTWEILNDATAGEDFIIRDATATADRMIIDADGNIGIGPTDPTYELDLIQSHNGSSCTMRIANTSNTTGSHAELFIENGGSSGGDPKINLQIDGVLSWGIGIDNDDSDKLKFGTSTNVGGNTKLTLQTDGKLGLGVTDPDTILEVNVDNTYIHGTDSGDNGYSRFRLGDSTGNGGYLQLYADNETVATTIRSYTISSCQAFFNGLNSDGSAGRVGIGKTEPTKQLEIEQSSAAGGGTISLTSSETSVADGDYIGQIYFRGRDADTYATGARIAVKGDGTWGDLSVDDDDAPSRMEFYLQSDGTGDVADPIMTIKASGNVGLGITDPTAALHVKHQGSGVAIPVCRLETLDVDESFIDFIGTTASDGSKNISTDTSADAAKFGAIKIEINGVTKWIRVYDDHS